MLALAGIRVLDLSRILAGPYCTMLLGDLGADVVKIEKPCVGDDTRAWGPPFVNGTSESAYFLSCNRNKRSVAVDLSQEEGRDICVQLAREADVLVENFLPGKLEGMGLGHEELMRVNPGLVYCSLTGYGQTGPYRDRGGYDLIAQAQGGLIHITGVEAGDRAKIGVAVSDIITGLYAHSSILAALFYRERTGGGRNRGGGQYIDAALLDCSVASLVNIGSNWLNAAQEARPLGTAHESIVPYQMLNTKDHPMVVAVANDRQFSRFCSLLAHPAVRSDDPRFHSNAQRVRNRSQLIPLVTKALAAHPRAHWLPLLHCNGIPCAPVNTIEEAFQDEQVLARGLVSTVEHTSAGPIRLVSPAVKMSLTPPSIRLPPPLLGQHTDEVLSTSLHYEADRLARLRQSAVIQ